MQQRGGANSVGRFTPARAHPPGAGQEGGQTLPCNYRETKALNWGISSSKTRQRWALLSWLQHLAFRASFFPL